MCFCLVFVFCLYSFIESIIYYVLFLCLEKLFIISLSMFVVNSAFLSFCLSVCQFSACQSVCPSVRPSVRPSVCLFVCLSVCLSVCLYHSTVQVCIRTFTIYILTYLFVMFFIHVLSLFLLTSVSLPALFILVCHVCLPFALFRLFYCLLSFIHSTPSV